MYDNLQVSLLMIALAIGATATEPKPRTTNVNTNYNNNYNSNLDLIFILLLNHLTSILTSLQKSGHLPKGEDESISGLPDLPQFPMVPSLFLDPSFSYSKPEDEHEDDGDLLELAGFKRDLASIFPTAESVNININKNQNTNLNLVYDYLINYLLAYQQSQVIDSGEATTLQKPVESKQSPVYTPNDLPKQVDDTPEVKEAKKMFQMAYDKAKARITHVLEK